MPAQPKPRRRWIVPAAVLTAAIVAGGGAGWALTGRSTEPPAADATPTPTPPRLPEASACLRAMDHTNVAIQLAATFSKDSSINLVELNRTITGLQEAQPSLPATTQEAVADVLDPLKRMQRAARAGNGTALTVDFTDFKAGAMEITIYCGVYLLDDPAAEPDPNVIDEGVWTVGDDIRPGRYRTDERVDSDCYWSITRSGSNGDDIIANDIPGGGRPTVTLRKGQDFTTRGCGTWTRLK